MLFLRRGVRGKEWCVARRQITRSWSSIQAYCSSSVVNNDKFLENKWSSVKTQRRNVRYYSSTTEKRFRPNGLDHVCICVQNVETSLEWYRNVLNFEHKYADEKSFGKDPAFLQNGNAKIALLPLHSSQTPVKNHNGAHFAFNVDREEFDRMRVELPKRLDTQVEEQDYDLQLSLFFSDPDDNILEITTWVDPTDPKRL